MSPLELKDDGWLLVKLDGQEYKLDFYEVYDDLYTAYKRHGPGQPKEFYQDLREVMTSHGLPAVSGKTALEFSQGVFSAFEAAKKNEAASSTANSAASTGPVLSD